MNAFKPRFFDGFRKAFGPSNQARNFESGGSTCQKECCERQWQEMPTTQKFAGCSRTSASIPLIIKRKTHERLCAKLVSKLKKEERFERMKLDDPSLVTPSIPKPAVYPQVESGSSFLHGAKGSKLRPV